MRAVEKEKKGNGSLEDGEMEMETARKKRGKI